MTDDQPQMPPQAAHPPSVDPDGPEAISLQQMDLDSPRAGVPWRSAWQLPLLVLSLVLIGTGLWSMRQPEVIEDPGALIGAAARKIPLSLALMALAA